MAAQALEERRIVGEKIATLDNAPTAMSRCQCCHSGDAFGSPSGICRECAAVIGQLRASQLASERIGPKTRRELALEWIAREEPQSA